MSPFLTLFTRHMTSRPNFYAKHCESLAEQTCQDFEHYVVTDDVGRGWQWAQAQFEAHKDAVRGDFIMQLDDDNALAIPEAVNLLKCLAEGSRPDIIAFHTDSLELGIIPHAVCWNKGPIKGHMSGQDVAVRREVWQRHIHAHSTGRYDSDYDFLAELWGCGYEVRWLDRLLVRCLRVSRGRPE